MPLTSPGNRPDTPDPCARLNGRLALVICLFVLGCKENSRPVSTASDPALAVDAGHDPDPIAARLIEAEARCGEAGRAGVLYFNAIRGAMDEFQQQAVGGQLARAARMLAERLAGLQPPSADSARSLAVAAAEIIRAAKELGRTGSPDADLDEAALEFTSAARGLDRAGRDFLDRCLPTRVPR